MAPELFQTMEANELRELAQKVREWQLGKKLSDNALAKKFAGIGSTKTYKRILDGDLAELDLERQLDNYRAVWAFIESIGDQERDEEEIYEDFYNVVQLRRAFGDTARERGLARVIFLQGPSGAGKTAAQRWLMEKYGPRMLTVRATTVWNDNPAAMLAAVLDALGVKDKPSSASERLNKVVEKLRETRRGLLVEDSHHLGPRCLNLVVTLVDETPGEFVLAAIDSLWRKLETKAYEECRQLTGNRLAERINLGREVRESDVRKLLERRVEWATPEDAKRVLRGLCEKAVSYGRLAFVRETIKRVVEMAAKEPVTAETFTTAMAEEVASR